MTTKHELAIQVAAAKGRPNDDATIAAYQCLPAEELQVHLMDLDECELCGEEPDGEMAQFQDDDRTEVVWCHAGCGEDAGLEMC